jgi:hypothetical protein
MDFYAALERERIIAETGMELLRLRRQIQAAWDAVDGEGHIRDNADPDQLRAMLLGAGLQIKMLKAEIVEMETWIGFASLGVEQALDQLTRLDNLPNVRARKTRKGG